ncbi:hypothetical protein Tco_1006264 [Tanacetum coccineum]|uniref:Reverse transcriptase domain-containing protein n=1 Tax=Tanacetum coccineum TaxID=301880 RepID=A0ABQ5FHK1_9ASTR
MVETLRVIRDMRREMSDMQAELLSLREQQRRARQPGPEARILDHQDASGDADSHIYLPDPKTLDDDNKLANDLNDQKLCIPTRESQSDNKKEGLNDSSRNNHGHQQQTFKRQNVAKKGNGAAPKGNGCFEYGAPGHFKERFPKYEEVKMEGNKNAQGWVYAVRKQKKRECIGNQMPNVFMVFLAQISAKKEEDKSEGKQIKDVPIVRDFPELFPEDLPGLPPARPVEF